MSLKSIPILYQCFWAGCDNFYQSELWRGQYQALFERSEKRPDAELWLYLLFDGACLLAARPFLEVFGLEPDALELGMMRVHIIIGFYFLSSIYESLAASMRGFGNSLAPALGMLVSIVGTRMLWLATVYEADPTFRNIMWCYPLSWFAADVLIGALFVREMGKQKRLSRV